MNIDKVILSRLWNIEFQSFVEKVLEIVRKYNPEALHLGLRFNAVNAFVPNRSNR